MAFGTQRLEITLVVSASLGKRYYVIYFIARVEGKPTTGASPSSRRSYDFLEIWRDVPFHALSTTRSTGSSGVGCQTKCAIERTQSGGAHLVLPPAQEQYRHANRYDHKRNQHWRVCLPRRFSVLQGKMSAWAIDFSAFPEDTKKHITEWSQRTALRTGFDEGRLIFVRKKQEKKAALYHNL